MSKEKRYIKPETFKGLKRTDFYFRNFRGENKFNPKDKRPTFAIKLDPVLADALEDKGWYIRWTKVRDDAPEDIEPIPYLKITLNFDTKKPPQVNMIVGKKVTELDGNTVSVLDGANISNMTIKVRAYDWDDSGKYGAAAFLVAANVYVEQDDLELELQEYMEEEDDEDAPF